MKSNRIDGAAHETAGSIKEGLGKMTGNNALRAKGATEKAAGSIQNAVGKAQDKLAKAEKH